MPLDRLIPTIPLRLNYIMWVEDILGKDVDSTVTGLDIGGLFWFNIVWGGSIIIILQSWLNNMA